MIVAGHLTVDPAARDAYLAGCRSVVELARRTPGCLDFAISADLVDPSRVNVYERWESRAAVEAFRSSGPDEEERPPMLGGTVAEHDIATVRVLFDTSPRLGDLDDGHETVPLP